jgi:hypothetical protein
MHEKYAEKGLVAMSVSLDDLKEDGAKDKVIKFLKSKKATFTNLVLDEEPEVWQEKLDIGGPPCVFIFGRDGAIAHKIDSGVDYKKIEKLVVELLEKKEK